MTSFAQKLLKSEVRLGSRAEVTAFRADIAALLEEGVSRKLIWTHLHRAGHVRTSYPQFNRRLRLMNLHRRSRQSPASAPVDAARPSDLQRALWQQGRAPGIQRFRPNPTPDLDSLV